MSRLKKMATVKRLKKKAINLKLFHGTSLEKLKGIASAGAIMPQEVGGGGIGGGIDSTWEGREEGNDHPAWKQKRQDYLGFTFLTNELRIAFYYSGIGQPSTNGKIVLEVDLPEESLLPDDNDAPDAKTWQESIEKVHECKVLGPIYSDYITGVAFYNAWSEKLIFRASLDNWEQQYEENKEKFQRDYDGGTQQPSFSRGWEKIYKEDPNSKSQRKEVKDGKQYEQNELEELANNGFEVVQDSNKFFVKNSPVKKYAEIIGDESSKIRGTIDSNGDITYGIGSGHPTNSDFIFDFSLFSESFELLDHKFSDLDSINKPNLINNLFKVFENVEVYFYDSEGEELEFNDFTDFLNGKL